MTQKEKAKDYDEALEQAKKELKTCGSENCDAARQIFRFFPQLYESENEDLKNKSGYYRAGKFWKASTLWNAVKGKIPQRVPNRYILQECTWNISSLQHFADEVKNVQEVDLNYPIILDINGNILDGAHRVVKAYLEGKDIDIVYLGDDEWPEPDYDEEKAVRESEDERIRKEIISALKFANDDGIYNKHIAYLEKQKRPENTSASTMIPSCWAEEPSLQKEQPTNEEMLRTLRVEYEKGVADTIAKYEQKEQDKCPEYCVRSHCLGCSIYEKQKEQKPSCWNSPVMTHEMIMDEQKEHQNKSDALGKTLGRDLTFPQNKDKNLDEIAQDYVDNVKEYNPEPTWDLLQTAVCYGYHYCEQKPDEIDGKALLHVSNKSYDIGFRDGVASVKPADDKAFEEWIDDWWKHNKVNNPDSYDKGDEIQFDERGFKNFCRGIRNMCANQKPVDFPTTDEEVNKFLETHSKVEVPEKYKTPDFVFSKQEYESHSIISKDTTSVKPAEDEFPYNTPADTIEGEIENIWNKLSCENRFTATKEGFREVLLHFVNYVRSNAAPEWSEDEERLIKTSISFLKDFADKGYENAVECIDWLKSKLNGNSC